MVIFSDSSKKMKKLAYVFLMGATLFNPASAFAEDRAVNINMLGTGGGVDSASVREVRKVIGSAFAHGTADTLYVYAPRVGGPVPREGGCLHARKQALVRRRVNLLLSSSGCVPYILPQELPTALNRPPPASPLDPPSHWSVAESRGNSVLTHNNTAISVPASAKQRMHKVPASPNLKYAHKYFNLFAVATARPIPMPVTQLEQAFPSIIPVNARCRRNRHAAGLQEGRALMGELVLTIPATTATPNGATPTVSEYAKQNRKTTANRTLTRITQLNNHRPKAGG
jgi:hypothetical protein